MAEGPLSVLEDAANAAEIAMADPGGAHGFGLILEDLPDYFGRLASKVDGLSIWAGGTSAVPQEISEQLVTIAQQLHAASDLAGEAFMTGFAQFTRD